MADECSPSLHDENLLGARLCLSNVMSAVAMGSTPACSDL